MKNRCFPDRQSTRSPLFCIQKLGFGADQREPKPRKNRKSIMDTIVIRTTRDDLKPHLLELLHQVFPECRIEVVFKEARAEEELVSIYRNAQQKE